VASLRGTTRFRIVALTLLAGLSGSCGGRAATSTAPTPSTPAPKSSVLLVTFAENPLPFRTTGCSPFTPQGWYTTARLQEIGGVSFTVTAFIQKVDGAVSPVLAESFNSRFGACESSTFTPNTISANGAVCGTVGICTADSVSTYQLQITGTDANGHTLTYDSPLLQLSRPMGAQGVSASTSSRAPSSRHGGNGVDQ
jgi:hypothetical protein